MLWFILAHPGFNHYDLQYNIVTPVWKAMELTIARTLRYIKFPKICRNLLHYGNYKQPGLVFVNNFC